MGVALTAKNKIRIVDGMIKRPLSTNINFSHGKDARDRRQQM